MIGIFEIAVKTAFLDWEAAVLPLNYARNKAGHLLHVCPFSSDLVTLFPGAPSSLPRTYSIRKCGAQTVYSPPDLRLRMSAYRGRSEVVGGGSNDAIDPQRTSHSNCANLESEPKGRRKHMTRILFVGQKPETVDFSDPALPPGFDAEKINAGIAVAVAKIGERGWQGDTCMITPDDAGRKMLEETLNKAAYDCVVIGGGLRIPPKSLTLFETVVNAVHRAAPGAKIAFNTRPEDTAEAAARQLGAG
jgi:hypothetical protein